MYIFHARSPVLSNFVSWYLSITDHTVDLSITNGSFFSSTDLVTVILLNSSLGLSQLSKPLKDSASRVGGHVEIPRYIMQ